MEKAIGTQAIEPWLADISRTLEKIELHLGNLLYAFQEAFPPSD